MKKRPFVHEDFLLQTETARRLYHEFAKPEPILDYHCHLPPKDIAENRQFQNLFEIWLEGDHYKWRAMRSNGVPERLVTGSGSPREKFQAWAATVPQTLRNPLYHWTHLELTRYFGIEELLDERSADRIWETAQERLRSEALSVHGILKANRVTALCTTDDPADDLRYHAQIAAGPLKGITQVLPTFRPDAALAVHRPQAWNAWRGRLAEVSGRGVDSLRDLLEALEQRARFFHAQGCRLSDHGLERCYAQPCTEAEAASIFQAAARGEASDGAGHEKFASFVMAFLGRLYAQLGWTMQLHLGALRNNNTRLLSALGADTGFDSIGDFSQAQALSAFLDRLDSDNALPRTILYNLNPADNYVFGTMLGNFQDGTVAGKIQFGSGWWFLDQREGMEWQMNALSNLGLLSRFVGMVTDSRSFLSYPRHEYFRRVLSNLLGGDIERGELPDDEALVGDLLRKVCYRNAESYFGFGRGC
jgi:glucuronate isomerase